MPALRTPVLLRTLPVLLLMMMMLAAASAAMAQSLPPEVDAALQRAKLPREALSLLVVDAEGKAAPRLNHRGQVPMNPASVMVKASPGVIR